MSIPERLWRVVKGRWVMSQDDYSSVEERVQARLSEASAYRELAEVLKAPEAPPGGVAPGTAGSGEARQEISAASARSTANAQSGARRSGGGEFDPLQACYELLQVRPGIDVTALVVAYEARIAEVQNRTYPDGSPERAVVESRRQAIEVAYSRLRDALNPTETRFERLEF